MIRTYTLITIIFLSFSVIGRSQTITTVAGGGAGDGGNPINALISPYHITVHKGVIYFGDLVQGSIRKIGTDGIIRKIAGCGQTFKFSETVMGGPATGTSLGYPASIAFDSKENLYFTDGGLNSVFKIDVAGMITRIAGTDTNSYNGDNIPAVDAALNDPLGIAIDNADNIYIADNRNHRIRKIDNSGIITTVAGNGLAQYFDTLVGNNGAATLAQIPGPMDVCIDNAGNIVGCGDNILFKINGTGTISEIPFTNISSSGLFNSVTTDNSGNLFANFIVSSNFSYTYKITSTGTATLIAGKDSSVYIDGNSATSVRLTNSGIALGDSGYVYLGDEYGFIRKIDHAGNIHTIAGEQNSICNGTTADNAVLDKPMTVTFDASSGSMYIFENTSVRRIRKVRGDGVISTLDTGEYAFGMCTDNAGDLYVAQAGRVKKITPAGIVSTYAGSDTVGFSGDGGPATTARINVARDIVMDKEGSLFFTDPNNHRVRKVSAAGIITTIAGGGTSIGGSADGGPATAARLTPISIALNAQGDIVISDSGRIRKITKEGIITTIAGPGVLGAPGDNGPATAAYLYMSINNRLAMDTSGNIFFTTTKSDIRMIDANGIITTIAGKDTAAFKGDGGPASAAKLNHPAGICIDDSGRIYVADQWNNRIRRINRKYTYPPPPVDIDPDNSLHIFPNPATTALQVKYNTGAPGDVHFQIFDAIGKKAVDFTITSTTGAINETILLPPAMPLGMYILKVMTQATSKTAQFIIAR